MENAFGSGSTVEKAAQTVLLLLDPAPWNNLDGLEIPRPVSLVRKAAGWLGDVPEADYSVVVFDADRTNGLSPEEYLEALRKLAPDATFLAVHHEPSLKKAVSYLKGGVFEYLVPPFEPRSFADTLSEALDNNDTYRQIVELNRLLLAEKEELELKNRELTAISAVARAVSRSLELDEVVDRLLTCVEETFNFDRAALGLVEPGAQREVTKLCRGMNALGVSGAVWDLCAKNCPPWADHVYNKGLVLAVEDTHADPLTQGTALAQLHGKGPLAKVPLVVRGAVVGVITVDNHRSGRPIHDSEIGILKIFADTAAVSVENSRLYQMVKDLALRDELTGLYNRRYLMERSEAEVGNAGRREHTVSFIMLDLDHFKLLNDRNDHFVGDMALKEVARLLTGHTRGIDVVARFGGEEIVVLLPATSLEDSRKVAEKLRAAIEHYKFKGEGELPGGTLTVSVGVSSYPDHGKTVRELLEAADKALYRAKHAGRNRVECAVSPGG